MFDVGDDQLLVLLFVMEAELDALGRGIVDAFVEQRQHMLVDPFTVFGDFVVARTGQQTA
jgi:hypothetical protein